MATIHIEASADIKQDDIEELQKDLTDVGLETEVIGSKSIVATTLLAIAIVKGGFEAAKAIKEAAKILHDFLHPKDKEKQRGTLVITDKSGQKIELNNFSIEELDKLLTDSHKS